MKIVNGRKVYEPDMFENKLKWNEKGTYQCCCCGSQFFMFDPDIWVYKHISYYFCTWSCFLAYDRYLDDLEAEKARLSQERKTMRYKKQYAKRKELKQCQN